MNQGAPSNHAGQDPDGPVRTVALVGQPNVGKTTLFNRLCGLRSHTANIPGSTVEAQVGRWGTSRVIDLPGTYAITLNQPEATVVRECLSGQRSDAFTPTVVLLVLDATNLQRGLHLAIETLAFGLPCVVVPMPCP